MRVTELELRSILADSLPYSFDPGFSLVNHSYIIVFCTNLEILGYFIWSFDSFFLTIAKNIPKHKGLFLPACGDGFRSSCPDQNFLYSWNHPFPQTFLTNLSKPRIYLCKIPTLIIETLAV